jgi:WD40 repeat protein
MTKVGVEKIATLTGHKDCIYTLERGKDEHHFFSAGGDGMIAEWDLSKPDEGRLIAQVSNSVYAIRKVAELGELIVGQNNEGLHFIDIEKRQETASIRITDAQIFDIQVMGDEVFAGCGDGTIHVVDRPGLRIKKSVKHSNERVRSIAIHPDKRELAVGYSDNTIRILHLDDLRVLKTIEGHENSVFTVVYDLKRSLLLTGSRDANLKIWSIEDGYELQESIVAHMYAINNIVLSPDGKYFASCSMDKSIKLWDAESRKLIKVIDKARHAGHATSVNKLVWSRNVNQLISGSDDRTVSVWQLEFTL